MQTINISLPAKLKYQASDLVKKGYYASFSDLIRDSLRRLLEKSQYDLLAEQAKKEASAGKAVVLKNEEEIDNYFKNI